MHRKSLLKKGFKGGWHSTSKTNLKKYGTEMKKVGYISKYRVVKFKHGFELYTKKKR